MSTYQISDECSYWIVYFSHFSFEVKKRPYLQTNEAGAPRCPGTEGGPGHINPTVDPRYVLVGYVETEGNTKNVPSTPYSSCQSHHPISSTCRDRHATIDGRARWCNPCLSRVVEHAQTGGVTRRYFVRHFCSQVFHAVCSRAGRKTRTILLQQVPFYLHLFPDPRMIARVVGGYAPLFC